MANVSKILFPIPRLSARGAHLQAVLGGVTGNFNPTARHIRNDHEHFDERIEEEWWPTSTSHARVDYNFAPVGAHEGQFGATNCFRNYDPATGALTFMGDRFDVPPMEAALNELRDTALTRRDMIRLQQITDQRPEQR